MGDEVKGPEPCTTYGYLSHVGDDYIVVSHTLGINDPDEYNGHISIPLGCIKAVDTLPQVSPTEAKDKGPWISPWALFIVCVTVLIARLHP